MMRDAEPVLSDLEALVVDVRAARSKYLAAAADTELTSERRAIKDLFAAVLALADNITEVDAVVAEMVEHEECYLLPELGQVILSALTSGRDLAQSLSAKVESSDDDLEKKRVTELVTSFSALNQQAMFIVMDAMDDDVLDQEAESTDGSDSDADRDD